MENEIDEPNFLTRQQAIEQGYTSVGKFDLQWQNGTNIDELTDDDLRVNMWLLFDTTTQHLSIDADTIKDSIMDQIDDQESQIGCDTMMGADALDGFDWSKLDELVAEVNKELESAPYRHLTKLRLIP